jgi:predicted GTPase
MKTLFKCDDCGAVFEEEELTTKSCGCEENTFTELEVEDKVLALMSHLGLEDPEDISVGYSDEIFEYGRQEYLVLTDDEADAKWDEELENYIDECILSELPEKYQPYFDRESWKRDAKFDGRGHSLSS